MGLAYIRIFVQSTHVYIYVKRRDEILDYLILFLRNFPSEKEMQKIWTQTTDHLKS